MIIYEILIKKKNPFRIILKYSPNPQLIFFFFNFKKLIIIFCKIMKK